MMIQVGENKKDVFIWLTNADQAGEKAEETLSAVIAEWKARGFYPVIFRSGRADLYDQTFALLKHNRDAAARREVRGARG